MTRRCVPLITLVALAAMAVPASAQAPLLSISAAKSVAAKKAEKVKNDLKSEGARKAKIPGCWRNNERQVSCFFSVYGYDSELDYKWECMLRVVVKLRPSGKYRVKYGHAVCG
jgi:hypothetical protein